MSAKWLIDQYMIDHNEQDLVALFRATGLEVKVGQFERFARGNDIPKYYDVDDCVVIYGSLEFVAQQQVHGYTPGAYYQEKALQCSSYIPQVPSDLLLNENHVLATFGDFVRRSDFFYQALGQNELFIRPNTGRKLFTGLSIAQSQFKDEIKSLEQLSGVAQDSLILVAPAQTIEAEYRFCIVNREVVTASQYQEHGEIKLSKHVPPEAWEAAKRMAQNPWQPDIAYVCDIAKTQSGMKMVELNALSCSGLYWCDIELLAHKVSVAAFLEHQGELSIGDIAPTSASRVHFR